jgi:hypothetical protein
MRFCPNCGNPVGGSPRYCAGCATQVGPEDEPPSTWLSRVAPAASHPVSPPVSPWSFQDPPAEPSWSARHPSREPDGSPWADSMPPWPDGAPPWADSASPPWAVSADPAAEDPAAVITLDPRASPADTEGAARPERRSRLSPGHGMTITAVMTTVALLVTGGIAAWQVGQMQSRPPAADTSLAASGTGKARPGQTRGPAATPARAAPSRSGPPAGPGAVTVTPAAAVQPHVRPVVMLLDSYFSAINQHDFPAYSSLFIPAIRAAMHDFGAGYQSTRDSRARLTGLAATGPEGLAATVTFVSHQTPADSPDHAACDRWHITLFLKSDGHGYHIRRQQPRFPADTFRACH